LHFKRENVSGNILYYASNLHFVYNFPIVRFIYCSSAGVYLKSDLLPHAEVSYVLTCISSCNFRNLQWLAFNHSYLSLQYN